MKKILTVISLAVLIFTQSCGQSGQTETGKETVKLPEAATESYGGEWAYAGMDKQIQADDPDFSVTGKGFEYRGGWLGVDSDGFFDLTVNYEPGADEKFSFEFDAFTKDNGVLLFGFWLYGADSVPDDGMPGEWIKISQNRLRYKDTSFDLNKDAVKIKLTAGPDGFTLYADGAELIRTDKGPDNGGGAIKLRSENAPVYISNTAFRLGY